MCTCFLLCMFVLRPFIYLVVSVPYFEVYAQFHCSVTLLSSCYFVLLHFFGFANVSWILILFRSNIPFELWLILGLRFCIMLDLPVYLSQYICPFCVVVFCHYPDTFALSYFVWSLSRYFCLFLFLVAAPILLTTATVVLWLFQYFCLSLFLWPFLFK